jgi:hypothetical protein
MAHSRDDAKRGVQQKAAFISATSSSMQYFLLPNAPLSPMRSGGGGATAHCVSLKGCFLLAYVSNMILS